MKEIRHDYSCGCSELHKVDFALTSHKSKEWREAKQCGVIALSFTCWKHIKKEMKDENTDN